MNADTPYIHIFIYLLFFVFEIIYLRGESPIRLQNRLSKVKKKKNYTLNRN